MAGVAPEFSVFLGRKKSRTTHDFLVMSRSSVRLVVIFHPRICCDLLIKNREKTGWSKMNISVVNGVKSTEKNMTLKKGL